MNSNTVHLDQALSQLANVNHAFAICSEYDLGDNQRQALLFMAWQELERAIKHIQAVKKLSGV